MMRSISVLLNDHLVTLTDTPLIIQRLEHDDGFLGDYVNQEARKGRFAFLFAEDPSLRRIVVRRPQPIPPDLKPVWTKKGRPSDDDTAATNLLLKLRSGAKYGPRFRVAATQRLAIWEEIAADMRARGFDVDAQKCAQRSANLFQSYLRYCQAAEGCACQQAEGDFAAEGLSEVFASMDESRGTKRKREDGEIGFAFVKEFLEKNAGMKAERFDKLCELIERRNQIMEAKLKGNQDFIRMLEQLMTTNK